MSPGVSGSFEFFKKRVDLLLAAPPSGSGPETTSSLFPPGQPPDLLVFVGRQDAAMLRSLRAQLPGRSFLLFFYLADKAALDFQEAAAHGRTLVCALEQGAACREKLAFLLTRLPRRQVRLVLDPGLAGKLGAWPDELREAIEFTLDNCQQERTRGLIRLRSSIFNLPSMILNSGIRMRPVPSGTDALVCGAGPSLELQLDQIKSARANLVLFAVGHAVPVLMQAGIVPDVVVEVDTQANINWPEGLKPDCLLAAAAEVAPQVAARFRRVLWFSGSSAAFAEGLAELGLRLPPLAMARTVTAAAIDLAIRFGCRRIALVGQDLALGLGGRLHAASSATEQDEPVVDLPGNDSPTVQSTRDLAELRDALQAFVRAVNQAFAGRQPAPLLCNCTSGGAQIQGLLRMELDAFLAGLQARTGKIELIEECNPVNIGANAIASAARAMEQAASDNACSACVAAWVQPVFACGAAIAGESIMPQGMADVEIEQRRLTLRTRLQQDLCGELAADLHAVARAMASHEHAPQNNAERSPNAFMSFRRLAVRCLQPLNAELADCMALSSFPVDLPQDRFVVRWRNQVAPHAKIRCSDGALIALTTFGDVAGQARMDVKRWLDEAAFDQDRHAVVFIAPGTWLHVTEFARQFPHAKAAVFEPWLDWLQALCDHGCMLHALPADTLVVAADERLPGWRRLLHERLRAWRACGLMVRLFPHPRLRGVPDIGALIKEFI